LGGRSLEADAGRQLGREPNTKVIEKIALDAQKDHWKDWEILGIDSFAEGKLPRRLFCMTLKKPMSKHLK
jgi:hypothetical protein